MIPKNLVRHLHEVDEKIIINAADLMGGENTFKTLLFHGEIYRKAGLEPMYMTTQDLANFVVTCRETLGTSLH